MFSKIEWTKNDLKHVLKHLFRGVALICQQYNPLISKK